MSGSPPDYDVLILSDLRYPGGNTASIVEEIKAQADAGYRHLIPLDEWRRRRPATNGRPT